jgi:hypothetical protein
MIRSADLKTHSSVKVDYVKVTTSTKIAGVEYEIYRPWLVNLGSQVLVNSLRLFPPGDPAEGTDAEYFRIFKRRQSSQGGN